ncbi:hypothetical protein [Pararhizobium sp.]|uniref:COG3904 family protein n=1 Tax=Pararhizobium sp. TaxID=1977563 RepID=UPI00271DB657|nr:hypothetical protein [Pararhizobium sp.]MDO9417768.1 hypothetical protein [Pararhizobium sp.]
MNVNATAARLKSAFLAMDDGALMRNVFYGLLAAAVVFLVIDLREINASNTALPGFDPTQPDTMPVLPPALTEGEPNSAPSDITADPEVLKKAIRFELKPGGILSAEGAIDPGAAARFAAEIETRGEYVKTVALNSPGGSIDDALAMSALIREKKLATSVATGALCASSCPIVFAGGAVREAGEDAVIGVHQVFNGAQEKPTPEEAMSSAQMITARVGRHLDAMGIKPGLWLHALETPPDRLYYLTPQEMRDLSLTTPPVEAVARKKKT